MKRKRRNKRIDEAAEKLKNHFREGGYEVVDSDDFFSGINKLYRKPTVEQVIEEESPIIQGIDPDIFIREQIDLSNASQRLSRLYSGNELENAYWIFKVGFRHVRFFLRDAPEERNPLDMSLENLKLLLDGRYFYEELLIEYILAKQNVYYEDYRDMRKSIKDLYNKN